MLNHDSMLAGVRSQASTATDLTSAHAPLHGSHHLAAGIGLPQVDQPHLEVDGAARLARLGDLERRQPVLEPRCAPCSLRSNPPSMPVHATDAASPRASRARAVHGRLALDVEVITSGAEASAGAVVANAGDERRRCQRAERDA